jgi:hypothetical protein
MATKGWAYAVFDYDSATATFKPDATGVVTCGFSCHTRVAAKDYIFTGLCDALTDALGPETFSATLEVECDTRD